MRVGPTLTVRLFTTFIVPLLALSAGLPACSTANSVTTSSSMVTSNGARTGELGQQSGAPQTLPAVDGWTIKLIPATDKIRAQYDPVPEPESVSGNGVWSPPGPLTFEPSVAIDGDRVAYSAFYGGRPQVYLYDIASGAVTQLTRDVADPKTAYGEQVQVQISGDWVAWQRGTNVEAICLQNVVTGETKQFQPQKTVTSWRLAGGRLAWAEGIELHDAQLYLYDPAVGSVQTIASAHGLRGFAMDDKHIAWVGGTNWNEMYLFDLVTGETKKVTDASQHAGEDLVLKGNVLAWVERYGDLSRLVVCSLETGDKKVLDEFGPFSPELQSDGRYLAWNRGEEATGTEVRVYDTETGQQIRLGGSGQDSWPSIDAGRIAWTRAYPPGWEEVIMVRDLPNGPAMQLTNSPWVDQPPSISGDHIVWTRDSDLGSSAGRAIFVASRTDS